MRYTTQSRELAPSFYFNVHLYVTTVWDKDPGKYCTQFWPGWDAKLTPRMKTEYNIKDISKYMCFNTTKLLAVCVCMCGMDVTLTHQVYIPRSHSCGTVRHAIYYAFLEPKVGVNACGA